MVYVDAPEPPASWFASPVPKALRVLAAAEDPTNVWTATPIATICPAKLSVIAPEPLNFVFSAAVPNALILVTASPVPVIVISAGTEPSNKVTKYETEKSPVVI
jgi:hypothetical protein